MLWPWTNFHSRNGMRSRNSLFALSSQRPSLDDDQRVWIYSEADSDFDVPFGFVQPEKHITKRFSLSSICYYPEKKGLLLQLVSSFCPTDLHHYGWPCTVPTLWQICRLPRAVRSFSPCRSSNNGSRCRNKNTAHIKSPYINKGV